VTMLMRRASKTEGRKGSQRRLDEGGRYLGIPQNGGLVAPRTGSDDADAHNSGLLSVQEIGYTTSIPEERLSIFHISRDTTSVTARHRRRRHHRICENCRK